MCRLRSKSAEWIHFRTAAYTFLNPYSEEFEYIIATHTCLRYWRKLCVDFSFFGKIFLFFRPANTNPSGDQSLPTSPESYVSSGSGGTGAAGGAHWITPPQQPNDGYTPYSLQGKKHGFEFFQVDFVLFSNITSLF